MAAAISEIVGVLARYNIFPEGQDSPDGAEGADAPSPETVTPVVGEIGEGESVYTTSVDAVTAEGGDFRDDDDRLQEWWREIEQIISDGDRAFAHRVRRQLEGVEPPEPHCAWYCPIHYFGHGWGIYIREGCILSCAKDIASFVGWSSVLLSKPERMRQLLRSAFYVFFLHEQFHHKVESLGFRLLIATGRDCYRPYKSKVYRPTLSTIDCIEESLANAESIRRLKEERYINRLDPEIRSGLRQFLRFSIPLQPLGYDQGLKYVGEANYRVGLHKLKSRVLDAKILPTTPHNDWVVAPNMITALFDVSEEIYIILPKGARPIFRPTSVDPGQTATTYQIEVALINHYGYKKVYGGKGSHIKLKRDGANTIVLPGNRKVLSPGIVKEVLNIFGRYPLSKLPDFLAGTLERVAA